MTVDELFSELSVHMIKGMMLHEQMANYYHFLGLEGYKKCHEYHYISESLTFRKLNCFYVEQYNKLIPNVKIENTDIIPNNWYNHVRQDVDTNTKRNAIQSGLVKWVKWEKDTKVLLEQTYRDLIDIDEVAGALFISEMIKDVCEEIKDAEQYHLNKESIAYDMIQIIDEQKKDSSKYSKKIKECINQYFE